MAGELISVVVPARDEEQVLPDLYREVRGALEPAGLDFELIIVDDGSEDGTAAAIERLAAGDPRVRGIHLARSFGHQFALLAGLEDARGDAVVTIDADLEQPPAAILDLVARWREGFDVVHGVRIDHPGTSWFKRTTSRWFYRLFAFLSHIPMEPGMLDFRLMDRKVADAVLAHTESDFFLRGIANWVGFRQARIPYRSGLRFAGSTKFTTRRMVGFAVRGITSFSVFPLRLATWLGLLMTLLSLGFGAFVGIRYFFWEHPQPGYASTILLVAFLFGVQFLLIGLLGEYVARIHVEVKKRPRYLVARRTGEPPGAGEPGA
jgi:dolichol-phosphate mannosyltransferase